MAEKKSASDSFDGELYKQNCYLLSVLKFILLYALTCHTTISQLCILLPEVNVIEVSTKVSTVSLTLP